MEQLALGCGQIPEASIRHGVHELAKAIRAARARSASAAWLSGR